MSIALRWDLPPTRALEFFRAKGLQDTFAWQDMLHEHHDAAFTVAKMLDLDLLRDVRQAVDRALAEGLTLREFRAELEPLLVERGWWGRAMMEDPHTGEIREVQLGSPRRLRTIFRVNLRTAYAAGHWSRIVDHAQRAPYLLYDAVLDERTRPDHRSWDGIVLRWDDPWWQTHYPPNGWNCRCSVVQLDERQLRRLGKSGPDRAPEVTTREWLNPRTGEILQVPHGIDPGWAYHPGRSRAEQLRRQLEDKARAAPELGRRAVAAAEAVRPPSLDEAIEEGRARIEALARDESGSLSAVALRSGLRESLAAERGLSHEARVESRGRGAELVRIASRHYPDDWVRAADAYGPLYARYDRGRGGHWTAPDRYVGRRVRLPGWGVISPPPGAGYIRVRDQSVAIHEYAHRLQVALPALDDYFQQLHLRRTQGQPRRRLRELTEIDYGLDEVAQEDHYYNPYTGKIYGPHPGLAHIGRAGALEVMAMAYQHIWADDLRTLQRVLEHDPELIALAVGLLYRYRP